MHGSKITWLFPSTLPYLRDALDHVIKLLMDIDVLRETLANAQANYLAKVSSELAAVSNNTNEVMRTLTIGATIVLPLTFITSAWGMNVPVPGQSEESLGPFLGICAAMAAVAVAMIFWFRRRKLM